ncbi:UNVERIFIED_CONTAM: hypothetical protein NCL1_52148 [Trichonephila clavipes]
MLCYFRTWIVVISCMNTRMRAVLLIIAKRREELHGHVRNSCLEGVARLIKSDNTLVTAKSRRARCALHVAVLFEHVGIITALVKANSSAVHVADNV